MAANSFQLQFEKRMNRMDNDGAILTARDLRAVRRESTKAREQNA